MKTAPITGAPLNLLVIEDVESMRQLLDYLLRGIPECKAVGLAKNTLEARVELSKRRPDLVILDEVIPGESSTDLLADLIKLGLPVLMMSGMEDVAHPLAAGAKGRIRKPSWGSVEDDRTEIRAQILRALRS